MQSSYHTNWALPKSRSFLSCTGTSLPSPFSLQAPLSLGCVLGVGKAGIVGLGVEATVDAGPGFVVIADAVLSARWRSTADGRHVVLHEVLGAPTRAVALMI